MTHIDPEGTGQLLADDIRDTIFEDNGIGLYLGSRGDRTTIVCRNRFIANNEFEGTGGANGIYSDEGAQDVLITSNRFEGHNTSAIFFADVDEDFPGPTSAICIGRAGVRGPRQPRPRQRQGRHPPRTRVRRRPGHRQHRHRQRRRHRRPQGICIAPADNDQPTGDGKDHHGHGKSHKNKHHKQHPKHRPDPCECGSLPRRF